MSHNFTCKKCGQKIAVENVCMICDYRSPESETSTALVPYKKNEIAKPTTAHTTIEPIRAGVLGHICGSLMKQPPEGFRHLWLGDTGMGKTEANRILITAVRKRRVVDLTITVDEKTAWTSQYENCGGGQVHRISPEHLRANPPQQGEDPSHIIFRGVAMTRKLDGSLKNLPFDAAVMASELVFQAQCSVLLNIDELADATNGFQSWEGDEIAELYRKGRGMGISIVATTQLPQSLPREAFGLSDTIGVFRMSGREADYLRQKNVIDASQVAEIQNLQVGEFRLYRKSHPLDPSIYKFVL